MLNNVTYVFLNKSFFRFVVVGVVNTIVGTAIMLIFYNVFHFCYWFSSASNYFLTSILSFFLNKYYTFQYKEGGWKPVFRFAMNIIICYVIAFGLARPFVRWSLEHVEWALSLGWVENVAMIFGSVLFVVINYLGQRFFAFKKA